MVREEAPALPVSISSDVLPEFREYERTVTTVVNAYVSPVLDRYLSSLRDGLRSEGTGAELQVVRSDGGLMSVDSARATPVHTVLSGPAGGVQGAAFVASRSGLRPHPHLRHGRHLDRRGHLHRRRSRRSRARPRWASSRSGRRGGGGEHRRRRRLDRLRRRCDRRAARRTAQRRRRPRPRLLRPRRHRADRHRRQRRARSPAAAAARRRDGARRRGGHAAVRALGKPLGARRPGGRHGHRRHRQREHARRAARGDRAERPRSRATSRSSSFGGAGGLHANALAALLGCFPVLVPPESGVLSALGFVAAEIKNEFSQTYIRDAARRCRTRSGARFAALAAKADEWLAGERVAPADGSSTTGRHALPPPGIRDPDRARGPDELAGLSIAAWSSASTRCTSGCTASASRAGLRWSACARRRGGRRRSTKSRRTT